MNQESINKALRKQFKENSMNNTTQESFNKNIFEMNQDYFNEESSREAKTEQINEALRKQFKENSKIPSQESFNRALRKQLSKES